MGFGIGCQENVSRAEELYHELLRDGNWAGRVAGLSGLGLQRLRAYFLQAKRSLQPIAGYLHKFGTWLSSKFVAGWQSLAGAAAATTSTVTARAPLLSRIVIRDPFGWSAVPHSSASKDRGQSRRIIGRLTYAVIE